MTMGKVEKGPTRARSEERVLGLARSSIPGGTDWRGLREVELDAVLAAVDREGTFRARDDAELDPSWKQVIPYVIVTDGPRTFLMRRTRAGGDARLHERYSIGVGGHVAPDDAGVLGGLRREWREELDAGFDPDFRPLGLLNDDTDPVGSVHLGLVYTVDAGGRPVAVRETEKLSGAFATRADIARVHDDLETWSQLLFDALSSRVR